jgi:drug/metabolite transporter (DMT)-like permease
MENNRRAVLTGLMAPVFLGMAPILGKLAIKGGADPFTVAAWRTAVAVAVLWGVYILFARRYIYIYPAGLFGCIVLGLVNGIGSLFYYSGLQLVDASLAQLLNGMYLAFVVLLSHLGGEYLDRRIIVRVALATMALVIITGFGRETTNWLGAGLMLANALMFAGTVILSQYVLYEMPAPTVTLYALTTMSVVVSVVWVAVGTPVRGDAFQNVMPPIFLLAISTAASRVALFSGVKIFGSLQTAILALAEIGVALALAFFILGERLTPSQVAGVALLAFSILLIRSKDVLPRGINPNQLFYNIADVQFQWIAFDQAFGKRSAGNDTPSMPKLSTEEVDQIRRMMGASSGAVTPITLKNQSDVLPPLTRPTAQLRAYYPAKLEGATWLPLRAYVFREGVTSAVEEDARQQITAEAQWEESSPLELDTNALLTLNLTWEGFEVSPSSITRRFEGEWQRFDFYLQVNPAEKTAPSGRLTLSAPGHPQTEIALDQEGRA